MPMPVLEAPPRKLARALPRSYAPIGMKRTNSSRLRNVILPAWLVLGDEDNVVAEAYQVKQLPTLVAVGRDGRVLAVRRRLVPENELTVLLETFRNK